MHIFAGEEIVNDSTNLARDIQRRCWQWFDHHGTGIPIPIAVSILFTELSLVEVQLNADSFLDSSDRLKRKNKEAQSRGDVIASVDQMIKQHPELEIQLRHDLDRLWADYLPKTG